MPRPPPKPMGAKKLQKMVELTKDTEANEEAKGASEEGRWHDMNGPQARARRDNAYTEYAHIIGEIYPDKELFDIETIIEYTGTYLKRIASQIVGAIDSKPKIGTLFQRKEALYWWILRCIPKFQDIVLQWHAVISGTIGTIALKLGFSTEVREKNNLTDIELDVLFRALQDEKVAVDNWKQHYIAWILTWTTSVRPGSIALSAMYAAGQSLGAGILRPIDETLRWNDINFVRVDDTIIVEIAFKFSKGHRNPMTNKYIAGVRNFRFLEPTSNRFHMEIGLLLMLLGIERGLFPNITTYEQLLAVDVVNIPKDPIINNQPVLVYVQPGTGALVFDKPMRDLSLNRFLQNACTKVGFWRRNTMYSFRRAAIIDTMRSEGSELARNLAGHEPNGSTILVYDNVGLADLDIVSMRLGGPQTSREDVRALFSQANTAKVNVSDDMGAQLEVYVRAKLEEDEEYIAAEENLAKTIAMIHTELDMNQGSPAPTVLDTRNILAENESNSQDYVELQRSLQGVLSARSNTRRRLRDHYVAEFKKFTMKHHKDTAKMLTQNRTGSRGIHTQIENQIRETSDASNRGAINAGIVSKAAAIDNLQLGASNTILAEKDQWEDVDAQTIARAKFAKAADDGEPNAEPDSLSSVPDGAVIECVGGTLATSDGKGNSDLATKEGRHAFAQAWLKHKNIPRVGVRCLLCQLDNTVVGISKRILYVSMTELDKHMRTAFHSSEAQLGRAEKIDEENAMSEDGSSDL